MSINQAKFDAIISIYGDPDLEPIENWDTADIVSLIETLDSELQQRAPADGQVVSYDDLLDTEGWEGESLDDFFEDLDQEDL